MWRHRRSRSDRRRNRPATARVMDHEIAPPILVWPVLGPPGLRHDHFVWSSGRWRQCAPNRRPGPLSTRTCRYRCRACRSCTGSPLNPGQSEILVDPTERGREQARQRLEVGEVADLERGMASSASESRHRSRRRPCPPAAHSSDRSAHRSGRERCSAMPSASAVSSNRRTICGCGITPFSVPRPWKE